MLNSPRPDRPGSGLRIGILLALGALVGFAAQAAPAARTCEVGGTLHSTLQRAIDDPGCAVVLLPAGTYAEALSIDRSLILRGSGGDHSILRGQIALSGPSTLVTLSDLTLQTCGQPIGRHDGAQLVTAAVQRTETSSPCPLLGGPTMMARLDDDYLVFDSDDARDPRVGVDGAGSSYFVFTDTDSDTIQWISYDRDENLLDVAATLSTTASTQERADLAVRPDGSFFAAWRSDEDDGGGGEERQVRGRYYDIDDGLDPTDTLVNDLPDPTTARGLESGGVAGLTGGGFAVTWSSRQTHGTPDPGTNDDVQGQTVDSDGVVAATPQFHVNNLINNNRQTEADVGPMLDGGFLAVWGSYMTDGYQIRGRRYAANGTPMGDEFRIETDTTGGQHDPRVAMNAAGEVLVVWTHGSTPTTIRGRMFDANLTPLGDDFLISSRTDVKQQFPDVGAGEEHFVVAWEREEIDWDVEARVVTGHDSFDGPAFQVNSYDPPSLTHNEVGVGARDYRATITWQGTFDASSGLHSIAARTVHLCGIFCDGFESGDTTAW